MVREVSWRLFIITIKKTLHFLLLTKTSQTRFCTLAEHFLKKSNIEWHISKLRTREKPAKNKSWPL